MTPRRQLYVPVIAALMLMACDDTSRGSARTPAPDCLSDRACETPLVSAHRGRCGEASENTLAAMLHCEQVGVPMLEVDARETTDGVIVVMHDDDVTRTTDGEDRFPQKTRVDQLSAAEFVQLVIDDPGCTDAPDDAPMRCHPPTLDDVLLRTSDQTLIFLDFKSGDATRAAASVEAAGATRRVLFFDSDLDRLRDYRTALPGGLVCPRAQALDDFDALLAEPNRDLDLRWIHGDPQHIEAVASKLGEHGVRLYVNGFATVDVYLVLAELSSDPDQALELEQTAWQALDELVSGGAAGLGTEFGHLYSGHLYHEGPEL